MTTLYLTQVENRPATALIDAAIAEHGAMRVLLHAGLKAFRIRRLRRERPPDVSLLDARLRRDIGLLPELDLPDFRRMY